MAKQLQQDKLKIVSDYAWKWFSFHAEQRMKVFSFFFVVMAALTTAYYQTYDKPFIAITFTALGVAFSFAFWRIDVRNRELVKIGEDLLLELEAHMKSWGIANVRLVAQANSKKTKHTASCPNFIYSHGEVFPRYFF